MKSITLVLGASENPARYSNMACKLLTDYGHPVLAIGSRFGSVQNTTIQTDKIWNEPIDTVSLYLNPERQIEYYNYLMSIRPRRIIFNPGTENPGLENLAQAHGIECIEACTLVMLKTNQY